MSNLNKQSAAKAAESFKDVPKFPSSVQPQTPGTTSHACMGLN
ncbi:hypothetical protein [Pseudoalteromonas sp. NBT06-2]|nr:hypothetical protein [Pseudoalteromonas sp. NBT06-2]